MISKEFQIIPNNVAGVPYVQNALYLCMSDCVGHNLLDVKMHSPRTLNKFVLEVSSEGLELFSLSWKR